MRAPPLFSLDVVLAQRHRQHGIAPQFIVVIEILVTQRQPKHTLQDQIQQRVFDPVRAAVVLEAAGEPPHDPGPFFQLLQRQHSPIGGDVASIEAPNQLPSSQFLRCGQRLTEGIELARSLQRSDNQSHAYRDAGDPPQVTSFSRNVFDCLAYLR